MSRELKPCPKCGRKPLVVNKDGINWLVSAIGKKYFSCRAICMPIEEFYTHTAWNNMAKRELKLAEEIRILKSNN
jgi:hypothetical protein